MNSVSVFCFVLFLSIDFWPLLVPGPCFPIPDLHSRPGTSQETKGQLQWEKPKGGSGLMLGSHLSENWRLRDLRGPWWSRV
jgi:hypothetical protein